MNETVAKFFRIIGCGIVGAISGQILGGIILTFLSLFLFPNLLAGILTSQSAWKYILSWGPIIIGLIVGAILGARYQPKPQTYPLSGAVIGFFIGGMFGVFGPIIPLLFIIGNSLDQGALIIFITGPIGAIVGGAIGACYCSGKRRWLLGIGIGSAIGIIVGPMIALLLQEVALGFLTMVGAPLLGLAIETLVRGLQE